MLERQVEKIITIKTKIETNKLLKTNEVHQVKLYPMANPTCNLPSERSVLHVANVNTNSIVYLRNFCPS